VRFERGRTSAKLGSTVEDADKVDVVGSVVKGGNGTPNSKWDSGIPRSGEE